MRNYNILLTLVFSVLITGTMLLAPLSNAGAADQKAMSNDTVKAELMSLNNSGVTGEATLTAMGDKTKVSVVLKGAAMDVAHPIHIHEGSCDKLGAPKYPLNDVMNGKSETTIDAKLSDLTSGNFAINAHKSKKMITDYIACGSIPKK